MKIEIRHIEKSYRHHPILRDVSFEAASGECVGILGRNGCGKTTLLSILSGVLPGDGGAFLLDGRDLFKDDALRRQTVGYVPQGTPLFEELTGRENLLFWYGKKELSEALASDSALRALELEPFLDTRVSRMSGGMKKRLSICCAVCRSPSVLLLDEPSAALDIPCRENVASYLRKFKANGGTVFLSSHEMSELSLCDRLFILRDGVLVPFESGDLSALPEAL